jgi:hypothetical protein
LVVVAALIKLIARPVVFVQTRVGLDRRDPAEGAGNVDGSSI